MSLRSPTTTFAPRWARAEREVEIGYVIVTIRFIGSPTLSFVATSVAGDGTNCKRAILEKNVDHSPTLFTGGADDCDDFLAHNVAWLDVDITDDVCA